MAASIAERIAAVVQGTLASPAITGIGTNVFRAREDALTREDGDMLNVVCDAEALRVHSDDLDDCELTLDVQIHVNGDVWETKADAYAVQAHARIMACDYLGAGIRLARVRRSDGDWSAEAGDQTPGKRTLKYAFRYFTFAADITKQP